MKDFIKKIQNLPESKRKVILWSVMVIIGLGLFTLYIKNVQEKIKSFEMERVKEEFQIPFLEEQLKELPKFEMPEIEMPEVEMPEIDEEELKELERMMEEEQEIE